MSGKTFPHRYMAGIQVCHEENLPAFKTVKAGDKFFATLCVEASMKWFCQSCSHWHFWHGKVPKALAKRLRSENVEFELAPKPEKPEQVKPHTYRRHWRRYQTKL